MTFNDVHFSLSPSWTENSSIFILELSRFAGSWSFVWTLVYACLFITYLEALTLNNLINKLIFRILFIKIFHYLRTIIDIKIIASLFIITIFHILFLWIYSGQIERNCCLLFFEKLYKRKFMTKKSLSLNLYYSKILLRFKGSFKKTTVKNFNNDLI